MFSWRDLPRTPVIVAHRGSSAHAPENTLAAFARALQDGADAVELDAQLTGDGHVVVIHDFTLRRTAGKRARVEDTPLAALRALRTGGRGALGEKIPLLDEVFDLVGGRIGINVELKVPGRGRRGTELLARVLTTIRSHHAEASTLISSFNHRLIYRLGVEHPTCPRGLLLTPLQLLRPPRAQGVVVDFFIGGKRSLTRGLVERSHARGVRVGAFTVNGVRDAERLAERGVDMLVTDDPLKLGKLFA
jgi:glycerophosphoryl diester phosphodiesterase